MAWTVRPTLIIHLLAVLCAALFAVACAPEDADVPATRTEEDGAAMGEGMDDMADEGMDDMGDMADEGMDDMGDMADEGMDEGMDDMGGMAMDDRAEITLLAEAEIEALPSERVGWVGYRIDGGGGASGSHSWGPAFLYADEGARSLEVDGMQVSLQAGEAIFVAEGAEHTAVDGSHWAFLLTDPEAAPPPALQDATPELASGPLEGLPTGGAELRFLVVDLPPQDGRTAVHTHPGPEFIYVAQGEIEYETGLEATTELTVGDHAALPGDTAVQKRNVSDEPARFWSWFVVDPEEPFSTEAAFDRS